MSKLIWDDDPAKITYSTWFHLIVNKIIMKIIDQRKDYSTFNHFIIIIIEWDGESTWQTTPSVVERWIEWSWSLMHDGILKKSSACGTSDQHSL